MREADTRTGDGKGSGVGRVLGRSGMEVSEIGFGCSALGGPFTLDSRPDGWGEVDDDESVAAVARPSPWH